MSPFTCRVLNPQALQSAQIADTTKGDVMKQLLPIIDGFEQVSTPRFISS